jgi:hypothetical protein
MSENNVTKEALREKYLKKIEQDLDELKKKQTQSPENITFDKEKEISFTIELIKYLTAELANTKAELWLLKQSTKEPH